jgi:hypothetical protein
MKHNDTINKQQFSITISVLVTLLITLLIVNLAVALPFQSHPGEEIIGEVTEAVMSCAQLQQSDITDDSDFCLDLDTRCDATFPCTTLCLSGVCINAFADLEDLLNISASGGGSSASADCTGNGFLRSIDGASSVCEKVMAYDLDSSVTSTIGADYCADGTCAGDLYLPSGNHLKLDDINQIQFMVGSSVAAAITGFSGANKIGLQTGGNTHLLVDELGRVRIGDTSVTSPHTLQVKSSLGFGVIDISSPVGEVSAVDFLDGDTAKWGIGKNPANEFYIAESSVADVVTITPGGTPGAAELDVDGNINASGIICDGNGCIGDSPWLWDVGDIYFDTGNVGIGITDPQVELDVLGDAVFTSDMFVVEGNADPNLLYVDGLNNRVGIGTSNPGRKLDVVGDVRTSSREKFIAMYGSNEDHAGHLSWNGLALGNNGGNWIIAGNTVAGGDLHFVVNNIADLADSNDIGSAHNGLEAMTILDSGNVGIGTTDPTETLHVAGTAKVDTALWAGGLYSIGDAMIGTGASGGSLEVRGDLEVDGDIIGGQRCTTWKFDNEAGTVAKYWKFDMPYECYPVYVNVGDTETTWGCTYHLSPLHHSGAVDGYWPSDRSAEFIIVPDGDNTGDHYLYLWDMGATWGPYNIESGSSETILWYHRSDACRVREGWYDGASWNLGSHDYPNGWKDWSMWATTRTTCYLKICEVVFNEPITYPNPTCTSGASPCS